MAFSKEWQQEWDRRYTDEFHKWRDPDPLLPALYESFLKSAFPNGGRVLDVAGGMGRHALWMAEQGWQAEVWDYSRVALNNMQRIAEERGLRVKTVQKEIHEADFPAESFDLVMVFYFLDRAVFPKLKQAIRRGGFLLYRTFTIEQLEFERGPKDEEFLLQPNELLHSFADLHVVHYREEITDGARAEILAQKR